MGGNALFIGKRSRSRALRLETGENTGEIDEEESGEIIFFNHGETSIQLLSTRKCYDSSNCDEYDKQLIDSPLWWHQIVAGVVNCTFKHFLLSESRLADHSLSQYQRCCRESFLIRLVLKQIPRNQMISFLQDSLPEIHKLVGCYFVPIAYKSSLTSDSFLVHEQGEALRQLFDNCLKIDVKGQKIHLKVKLCVAKFENGMLRPRYKLREVLKSSVNPAEPYILNLSNISKHPILKDIKFSLSNKACLQLLIDQMQYVWPHIERVKIIDLSNNSIQHLKPLSKLPPWHLRMLSIKHNNVSSIAELNALQKVKVDKILLTGNPVVKVPYFCEKLKETLPQLKEIEELEIEMLPSLEGRAAPRTLASNEKDASDYDHEPMPTELTAVSMLRHFTKLNEVWCKRILEDSAWNMATACKFVQEFIERGILIDVDFE